MNSAPKLQITHGNTNFRFSDGQILNFKNFLDDERGKSSSFDRSFIMKWLSNNKFEPFFYKVDNLVGVAYKLHYDFYQPDEQYKGAMRKFLANEALFNKEIKYDIKNKSSMVYFSHPLRHYLELKEIKGIFEGYTATFPMIVLDGWYQIDSFHHTKIIEIVNDQKSPIHQLIVKDSNDNGGKGISFLVFDGDDYCNTLPKFKSYQTFPELNEIFITQDTAERIKVYFKQYCHENYSEENYKGVKVVVNNTENHIEKQIIGNQSVAQQTVQCQTIQNAQITNIQGDSFQGALFGNNTMINSGSFSNGHTPSDMGNHQIAHVKKGNETGVLIGRDSTKKDKVPQAFKDALENVLQAIEKRAKERNLEFSRERMPGKIEDLFRLCKATEITQFTSIVYETFSEYREGLAVFTKGVKNNSTFYKNLFPELTFSETPIARHDK